MQRVLDVVVQVLTALWHWRWPGIIVAWSICVVGWSAIAFLPDYYTVSARVVADTKTILGPLMDDLAASRDFDRQARTILDMALSDPNLNELIERTGIDRHRNATSPAERAELLDDLAKEITLSVEGRNLFIVQFTENDPDMAQRVVDAMLQIVITRNQARSRRDVAKARQFIEEQIAVYDERLRASELELVEFNREHDVDLSRAEQGAQARERAKTELRSLRSETDQAVRRRDQLGGELASTPKRVPASHASGKKSGAQQYLEELILELGRKRSLHTEQHPDVISLKELIDRANRQLQRDRQTNQPRGLVRNPLHDQTMRRLEVAEVEVQDLRRRLEDAEREVETLSKEGPRALAAEADLMRLSRDYDVLIQHYEQLIKHREATQLASNLPAGHQRTGYRIVDRPLHPVEPSGPPRGLLVIGVFVAGIGAGGAFAILRLLMTGTVLTAAQLQGAFKTIPILGGVAVAPLPQLRGQRLKSRVGAAGAAISLVAACGLLFLYHENSSLALNGVSPSTDLAQLVVNKISSLFASREATAGL